MAQAGMGGTADSEVVQAGRSHGVTTTRPGSNTRVSDVVVGPQLSERVFVPATPTRVTTEARRFGAMAETPIPATTGADLDFRHMRPSCPTTFLGPRRALESFECPSDTCRNRQATGVVAPGIMWMGEGGLFTVSEDPHETVS